MTWEPCLPFKCYLKSKYHSYRRHPRVFSSHITCSSHLLEVPEFVFNFPAEPEAGHVKDRCVYVWPGHACYIDPFPKATICQAGIKLPPSQLDGLLDHPAPAPTLSLFTAPSPPAPATPQASPHESSARVLSRRTLEGQTEALLAYYIYPRDGERQSSVCKKHLATGGCPVATAMSDVTLNMPGLTAKAEPRPHKRLRGMALTPLHGCWQWTGGVLLRARPSACTATADAPAESCCSPWPHNPRVTPWGLHVQLGVCGARAQHSSRSNGHAMTTLTFFIAPASSCRHCSAAAGSTLANPQIASRCLGQAASSRKQTVPNASSYPLSTKGR